MQEDKELSAIGKIIKEFETISEERRQAALKYVLERLSLSGSFNKSVNAEQTKSNGSFEDGNIESIKEFLDKKNPKNNYQALACLGYYLDKFDKKEEFGSKDLIEANARARRPGISNVARDLADATRKLKFFTKGTNERRKKMLTSHGEKVVEALPDQEAVKLVQSRARTPSKKKSNKNKK